MHGTPLPNAATLDIAHAYARRGWSVLPLHHVNNAGECSCIYGAVCPEQSRGKHPRWSKWTQRERMSNADIQAYWEEQPFDNLGIRTGAPSGFFVLDIDPKNGGLESWEELLGMQAYDFPETYTVTTGSGGLHLYLLMPSFDVTNSAKGLPRGLDVRGTGGLVVAPPSVSGIGAYRVLNDLPLAPAPGWLLALLEPSAAQVDTSTVAQEDLPAYADLDEDERDRLTTYTAQALTATVSEYETAGQGTGDGALFRAACATLELAQSPWNLTTGADAYAALDAARGRRNVRAAAWSGGQTDTDFARIWGSARSRTAGRGRALPPDPYAGVYFDPFPLRPDGATMVRTAGTETAPEQGRIHADTPEDTQEAEAPSWRRQDLSAIVAGAVEREKATLFARDDGPCLLYRGRVHSFHGESESGKSMVAQYAVSRVLIEGGRACVIDFESDALTVVPRLMDMGTPGEAILERFDYIQPDAKPASSAEETAAYEELLAETYDLIIVDGVTEGMSVFGAKSISDNDEASAWIRWFPRRLARATGAAVVLIDHVTKSADTRGRFAIGAQGKMAALDGAAYVVEVAKALGRGMSGAVRLRIGKDRPGAVRPECGKFDPADRTQEAAYVVIDSSGPDGRIRVSVRAPLAETDLDTGLMETISRFLETAPCAQSLRGVIRGVGVKQERVQRACNALAALGFIEITVKGATHQHLSIRTYRSDLSIDAAQAVDFSP